MLGWSINLFRVRGIQLALHFSFVLLLAYVAWEGYEGGGINSMLLSSAALLIFFTCVVLHEFGHSFTAMHYGVGVRRILLMPIGGMAEFDSIPREPRKELLITLAGPAVNFAIAGVLMLFVGLPHPLFPIWGYDDGNLVDLVLRWNLIMGSFNLLPVFPMDGGRILRALLAMRLPYLRATQVASRIGKVLAVAGIIICFYIGHNLTAALFAFIFFAGDNEYRSLLRREQQDAQWRVMMEQHRALRSVLPASEEPPLL